MSVVWEYLEAGVQIGPNPIFRKALKTNALALDSTNRLKVFRQTIKLKSTIIVSTEINSLTTSLLALLLALGAVLCAGINPPNKSIWAVHSCIGLSGGVVPVIGAAIAFVPDLSVMDTILVACDELWPGVQITHGKGVRFVIAPRHRTHETGVNAKLVLAREYAASSSRLKMRIHKAASTGRFAQC